MIYLIVPLIVLFVFDIIINVRNSRKLKKEKSAINVSDGLKGDK